MIYLLKSAYRALPLFVRVRIKFVYKLHYLPRFSAPRTFNEKLNAFKFGGYGPKVVQCADKVKVRDYVVEKGLEHILSEAHIIGERVSVDQVLEQLDVMEDMFLKANHNSGPVLRLRKGMPISYVEECCSSINEQLSSKYGYGNGELWYNDIQPLAFCEKTIKTESGEAPPDFKFHVFNRSQGKKIILQVDYDRFSDHNRTFYDERLNVIDVSLEYKNYFRPISTPENYEQMLRYVHLLAEDFNYVRVDLYNVTGKIYFGEMTFAPDGGFGRFNQRRYDVAWGALLG